MSPRKKTNGGSEEETPAAAASPEVLAIIAKLAEPAPFDSDDRAQEERDKCDYGQKISLDMAQAGTAPRSVRVYADGIYDLFHQGHARQLMQTKTLFPKSEVYLLVGCCNDALTRERKGETVMNESERYESIRHCRYVDEVVRDAPWTLDDDFLTKHKIDFVAHDELPYTTGSGVDVYADLKAKGMFAATQRTEGVSTSDIVARIVRNYDRFVRRNLARGYSRKDLNVSFLRGQRLKLQNKIEETTSFIGKKTDEYKHKWEDTSKEVIGNFLKMFGGNDWNLDNLWNRSKRSIAAALNSPANSDQEDEDDEDDEDEPQPSGTRSRMKVNPASSSSPKLSPKTRKRGSPSTSPSSPKRARK